MCAAHPGAPLLRGSSSDEVLRDPPSRADRFKLLGGGSSYARGSVDLDSEDLEELEDLSDEEEFDDSDEAEAEAEAERDLDDMMSEMESALSRNSTDGGAMVLSPREFFFSFLPSSQLFFPPSSVYPLYSFTPSVSAFLSFCPCFLSGALSLSFFSSSFVFLPVSVCPVHCLS